MSTKALLIHAELKGIEEPLIWRKFFIQRTVTLQRLGYYLQIMFEMTADHQFKF